MGCKFNNPILKKSPPWNTYAHKIMALFGQDPDIRIQFNEDDRILKLFVSSGRKAEAIQSLLPTEKNFGGTVLKIEVIPDNALKDSPLDVFVRAFEGNPVYAYAVTGQYGAFPMNYFVFANEVVQFYDDNLGDCHGNLTTLYEDIAREVFEGQEGIYFNTANPDELNAFIDEDSEECVDDTE